MSDAPPPDTPSFAWQRQSIAKHAPWTLTGIGFALGFGWLWFGALQRFWLPAFLWGNFFHGNASLFFALLAVGFTLALCALYIFHKKETQAPKGLVVEQIEKPPLGDFRSGKTPHIVHALSLSCICFGLFLSNATSLTDALSASCMAVAGIFLGLYWTATLMRLPKREGLAAFTVACLTASMLAFVYSRVPGAPPLWMLLATCFATWFVALVLSKFLAHMQAQAELSRKVALEQKRPRGRPLQRMEKANSPSAPGAAFSLSNVTATLFAFFFFGLGRAGLLPGAKTVVNCASIAPWLSLFLTACGALIVLCLLIRRERIGATPVSFVTVIGVAIGVQGGTLLLLPNIFSVFRPMFEGIVCIAVFALLVPVGGNVRLSPLSRQRLTWLHAAFTVLAALLSTNAGIVVVDLLHRLCRSDLNCAEHIANWVGAASLTAALIMLIAPCLRRTPEMRVPAEAAPEEIFVGLTPRAYEVAMLVAEGHSNKEIGKCLNISEQTVRFHLKNVYKQTGLSDREALSLGTHAAGALNACRRSSISAT